MPSRPAGGSGTVRSASGPTPPPGRLDARRPRARGRRASARDVTAADREALRAGVGREAVEFERRDAAAEPLRRLEQRTAIPAVRTRARRRAPPSRPRRRPRGWEGPRRRGAARRRSGRRSWHHRPCTNSTIRVRTAGIGVRRHAVAEVEHVRGRRAPARPPRRHAPRAPATGRRAAPGRCCPAAGRVRRAARSPRRAGCGSRRRSRRPPHRASPPAARRCRRRSARAGRRAPRLDLAPPPRPRRPGTVAEVAHVQSARSTPGPRAAVVGQRERARPRVEQLRGAGAGPHLRARGTRR